MKAHTRGKRGLAWLLGRRLPAALYGKYKIKRKPIAAPLELGVRNSLHCSFLPPFLKCPFVPLPPQWRLLHREWAQRRAFHPDAQYASIEKAQHASIVYSRHLPSTNISISISRFPSPRLQQVSSIVTSTVYRCWATGIFSSSHLLYDL